MTEIRKMQKDVLEFFNKALPELHVTAEVLQKPTCDNVKKIYSALLIHSGLKTEKQLLNDVGSLAVTDDLFMGGRRALVLNKAMENFARNALQCFDWSIRDLSSPDPPRTLRFIYELIHFSYFAQLRHAELEDIFKEKEKRERDELQDKITLATLNRQVEQKTKEYDQLLNRKHGLYKDRDELIRKNGQARASKALMQEQHDSLKLQLEEKLELRANVEDQLRELDENNHDLRGKLVRSPDRLHEEIKEIEQKNFDRAQLIQDCESSISKMEQQMQILSTEADRHLECFKEEFKTVKADIAAWENAQRMQTQLLMSLDRQRSEKNKLESTEAALARRHENDLSDLNSQLQLCQNKIEHFRALTQKHNENIALYTDKIELAQTEYVACQKRLEELKRKLGENPADSLKHVIFVKRREIEAEITDIEQCNECLKQDIIKLDANIPIYRKQYEEAMELLNNRAVHIK